MAHTNQERWATLVDAKLRSQLVTRDNLIFNNRYEGDPKAGKVKIPVRDTEVAVFLSTPFQKATKIQLLFNKLIAVAGTNVGVNAF